MAHSARQNAAPPHPHLPHVVVELVDKTDHAFHKAETGLKGVRLVSGIEAFRKYDWLHKGPGNHLRGMPVLNKAGNLRGMVVNRNARVIFNYSTNTLEKLEKYKVGNVLTLASFALEVAEKSEAIHASNEPGDVKASKYCLVASMAAIHALTGIIPLGAHVLAKSIEGYIDIADLATGHSSTTQNMLKNLRSVDSRVTSTYNQVTDVDNVYHVISTHTLF